MLMAAQLYKVLPRSQTHTFNQNSLYSCELNYQSGCFFNIFPYMDGGNSQILLSGDCTRIHSSRKNFFLLQLKKEDIHSNDPYSEQPSGQSIKVDDVYPHKIPLQIQSITNNPEPLDCTLLLHGQKDGKDFAQPFHLCVPRLAAQLTSPMLDHSRGKQTYVGILRFVL